MSGTSGPASPREAPAPAAQPEPARPRLHLRGREWLALALVLAVYTTTRLWGIADYPIYFFCDEAQQANLAHDLVADGFRDEDGKLFPAYFRNVRVFNLGLSVWIHALPVSVFGKTVAVVRTTSVAVGLVGVLALMLALKWFYGSRLWWAGGLVAAALPAWFLHSRTAFETAMMVGFYALFVLSYLLYREVSPWWAAAAIASGAATFYSYSNGQGVMFVSCLLLLVADWRYHWRVLRRHRSAAVAGLVVLVLLAAPYVRFRYVLHPEMMELHLEDLHTYWTEEIPITDKLGRFAGNYLGGLSPIYWFTEDEGELVRHRMRGYAHIPWWLAPAVLLGLAVALRRTPRSPAHRLLLIGVLAAPFSASLAGLRITRLLAMVVPATIAAVIGLDTLQRWLARLVPERLLAAAVAIGLTGAAAAMTRDALVNGPRWFTDYGMHGMQWGARELFIDIRHRLDDAPGGRMVISHSWANNTNAFGDFFLDAEQRTRIHWAVVDDILRETSGLVGPDTWFVMTPPEYQQAATSPKLWVDPRPTVIPDPSGRPGFYITRLRYTPAADALFAAERAARRRPVEAEVELAGRTVAVRHPRLDMGDIGDAFDGDLKSLARTLDANPCELALVFPEPRPLGGVRLHLWNEEYLVRARAVRAGGEVLQATARATTGPQQEPVELRFDAPAPDVVELALTIAKRGDVHIHLREIELIP